MIDYIFGSIHESEILSDPYKLIENNRQTNILFYILGKQIHLKLISFVALMLFTSDVSKSKLSLAGWLEL